MFLIMYYEFLMFRINCILEIIEFFVFIKNKYVIMFIIRYIDLFILLKKTFSNLFSCEVIILQSIILYHMKYLIKLYLSY
ncbi:MAG: hypothetical protein CACLOHII_00012 [Candidatus Westeberhardia cardiocondylae]|nr:hypothetical protein [Candidatus Westeberhardia cardiocondylae]